MSHQRQVCSRAGIQLWHHTLCLQSGIPDRARHHACGVIKVRVRNDGIGRVRSNSLRAFTQCSTPSLPSCDGRGHTIHRLLFVFFAFVCFASPNFFFLVPRLVTGLEPRLRNFSIPTAMQAVRTKDRLHRLPPRVMYPSKFQTFAIADGSDMPIPIALRSFCSKAFFCRCHPASPAPNSRCLSFHALHLLSSPTTGDPDHSFSAIFV